jgi:predicted glycoside hydrolase/deacetylase ChbG (UPF0249 family)
MKESKYLIVNADDFGLSPGVNRGIMHAHIHGIVTSASLMTRAEGATEAARYAKTHYDLSLGLHVDLGEWYCLESVWTPVYQVVDIEDSGEVRTEVVHQLAAFNRLVGRDPTHIDTHQHVHLREPVREVLTAIAEEIGVPLRQVGGRVNYCGNFYGQTEQGEPLPDAITVESLIRTLMLLPEGLTELACHPAMRIDFDTMYNVERVTELRTLCDPRVRDAITALDIELCSFKRIPQHFVGEKR